MSSFSDGEDLFDGHGQAFHAASSVPPLPTLVGKRVMLRPVEPPDYPFLRKLELYGPESVFFRYRGSTPPPEQFVQILNRNNLVQHMIVKNGTGDPIGYMFAFNADFRNGICHIAAVVDHTMRRRSWPLEGAKLFIDYLFTVFPFRKLYGEVLEPNLQSFRSVLGSTLREEGRLRSHEFHAGGYLDKIIVALWRDDWVDTRATPPTLSEAIAAKVHAEAVS